jgi:hypothetical protein
MARNVPSPSLLLPPRCSRTICAWCNCEIQAEERNYLFQFECVDFALLVAENKQAGVFSAVVTITSEALIIPGALAG